MIKTVYETKAKIPNYASFIIELISLKNNKNDKGMVKIKAKYCIENLN